MTNKKKKNKNKGGAKHQHHAPQDRAVAAAVVEVEKAGGGSADLPPYVMFKGGDAIILKCPAHKFESTVAFYRDILGMQGEQHSASLWSIDWGSGMSLYIARTDRLTHPAVWLTVDCSDPTVAKDILAKHATVRGDLEPWDPEQPEDSFWTSPPNDLVHLVKRPGQFAVRGGKAQPRTPNVSAQEDVEDSANPLNVGAASHAPTGQTAKLTDCSFTGGRNIALKCPPTKYESTVEFYRVTLGMEIVHYCRSCCKLRWNDTMFMWIDCVDTCATVTWLEVATASTAAAKAYLKGRKKVSLRPEVEALPPGVDGFWVSPPNDMVHLIRGPDGRDEAPLPPGELAGVPFMTAAQQYLEAQLKDNESEAPEEGAGEDDEEGDDAAAA
eukprot:TRINITY_DN3041_c1_g2_i1.p2 TRINITY_DN3041_c1_g2~~TRINITY_DN3041_c1_g2_i1.p2  ORF type:complete len:383 (+),score=149.82 TRINITY_DN3041_c1_g2_i1:107-1255(+)